MLKTSMMDTNNQQSRFDYKTYGAAANAGEVEHFLRHLLERAFQDTTSLPTPICIWGAHGIGKTELVQAIAKELNCDFCYIAPAQFEEMGDLVGMPKIVESDANDWVSRFMPPEWVPRSAGPGILLIDDVNRADDRILRGIMQLLQNHELISWKLPPRWQIILTANPDGGDYSVTPLDDAMLTRMLHITLIFEVKNWARWAEREGIDSRGINFVLAYPELINYRRTTPRTLVQFFQQMATIKQLQNEISLVKMLADACLEPEAAAAFISFVQTQWHQLISPQEIIETTSFPAIEQRLHDLIDLPTKRVDLLYLIGTRLVNYLRSKRPALNTAQQENLKQFFLLDLLPNDLRLSLLQDLTQSDYAAGQQLLAIPELGKILLERM